MTLANKITLVRILLIPFFIIGLLHNASWTLPLFIFCAVTDMMDGLAARLRKERTVLGTFLDPVADKLLLGSAFLVLSARGVVPVWLFVLVASRDLLILLGWNILYILTKSSTIEPRWPGKITTTTQMLAIIVYLTPSLASFRPALLLLTALFTFVSTADYVWVGGKKISRLG